MPALQFAGRFWPFADDDLVGFGVIGGTIRSCYIGYLVHALLHLRARAQFGDDELGLTRECARAVELFVLVAAGLSMVVLLVDVALSFSSASGVVWQVAPRRAVGPLLTVHVWMIVVEALWLAAGLLLPARLFGSCVDVLELRSATQGLHVVTIAWLALTSISTPAWIFVLFAFSRSVSQSALVTQREWCRQVFSLLCGCCVRNARDDTFDSIAKVLAALLSAHGAERAVVSDLLTGLLLVRDAQERASRAEAQRTEPARHPTDARARIEPPSSRGAQLWRGVASALAVEGLANRTAAGSSAVRSKFYRYKQVRMLRHADMDEVDAVRDAAHFMRFALAAYGMPMAVWVGDAATVGEGLCGRGCLGGCCRSCCHARSRAAREQVQGVERVRSHEIAFVRIARIAPSDMLASDWARRQRPSGACAYAVCVDRSSRSVVVAVRGTLDISDALTDVCAETVDASHMRVRDGGSDGGEADLTEFSDASEQPAEAQQGGAHHEPHVGARLHLVRTVEAARLGSRRGEGAESGGGSAGAQPRAAEELEWVSHRGIVEAATELLHDLAQKRVMQTLNRQLNDEQGLLRGYRLVVTGHSLGAGVASLLTLLLRANGFPAARCVAFSPPPILPRRAAQACEGAVLSVALEGDVVPRLSLASVHALAAQIVVELTRCQAPKWLIGLRATRRALARALCGDSGAPAPPLGAPLSLTACGPRSNGGLQLGGRHLLADGPPDGPASAAAADDVAGARARDGVTKLYVAGRVMLIESVEGSLRRYSVLPCLGHSAAEHEAKWVDPEEFQELKVSHNMIDHLPDRMAHILEQLASATHAAGAARALDGGPLPPPADLELGKPARP